MDDYDGFRAFVYSRERALMRTAYLLTGDPHLAEDLLQSVLAKVAQKWHKLERDANPEAYARRALVNEHISWRRRLRHAELPSAAPPDLPERGQDVELKLALRDALARLTPKQRAVIVLRYYEDRTERETADLLGCSVGTVKSQTNYALSKLRALAPELLSDLDPEEVAR
ncbi:SigE family RNA polymerase sigma factor [Nonomuraea sediminis]|uniref:SigE family RNA polymerase sigma factor n=1 Tax=Nonomuraea sediminis TaxID=2835864 RepID=UPI001BDCF468|nr:SigE family RNA polymerase sigma factor [Nonomuraea sediminis]